VETWRVDTTKRVGTGWKIKHGENRPDINHFGKSRSLFGLKLFKLCTVSSYAHVIHPTRSFGQSINSRNGSVMDNTEPINLAIFTDFQVGPSSGFGPQSLRCVTCVSNANNF
jgi:hypothetical protein